MATQKLKEYKVDIQKGKSISLVDVGIKKEDLKNYSFKSSESEHVSVNANGVISAKGGGAATISLYSKADKSRSAVVKVQVTEADGVSAVNGQDKILQKESSMANFEISNYLFIDKDVESILLKNGITSAKNVIEKFGSRDNRSACSKTMGINEYTAGLLFCEATLSCIPKMTKEFAYIAALVGIRCPEDLSKVSAQKLSDAFKLLKNNVMLTYPDFVFPDESQIKEIVQIAKDINGRYYDYFGLTGEMDPVYKSFVDDEILLKTDNEVLNEGLKFLENVRPALPLPKTVSGFVKVKRNNVNCDAEPQSGLRVSIGGISNPAQDKSENQQEYFCLTDAQGHFTIEMPDKYNLQETVTISVSKSHKMDYAVAGQKRSSQVDFVKRTSDLLKNEYLNTSSGEKNASEILEKINKIRDDNTKAKEIEKILNKLAYNKYAKIVKEKQRAEIENELERRKKNIENEVVYHVTKAKKKDIEILKSQYDEDLGKIIDTVKRTMESDKVVVACAGLLLGISNLNDESKSSANQNAPIDENVQPVAEPSVGTVQVVEPLKQKTSQEKFQLLNKRLKKYELIEANLDPSKKLVVEKTEKLVSKLSDLESVKVEKKTLTTLKKSVSTRSAEIKEPVPVEGASELDEIKEDLIVTLEKFIKELEDFKKVFDEKVVEISDKYEFIYYYEKEFLPKYSASAQVYQKKLIAYSNLVNDTQNEYDYKNDGFCDTLDELAQKCDLEAYFKIRDIDETLKQIMENWYLAFYPVDTFVEGENENEDTLEKLKKEHFCSDSVDPYEDILNKLPAFCSLLEKKVEDYVQTKNALKEVNAELEYIEKSNSEFVEVNEENSYFQSYINYLEGKDDADNGSFDFDEYAKKKYAEYKKLMESCESAFAEIECLDTPIAKGQNFDSSSKVERCILNFLSTPMDSKFPNDFIVNQQDLEDDMLYPRALPSVKFMGDGKNELYLPTDTAPSRMFSYTMVHRLVEPKVKKNGRTIERTKLNSALNIQNFKKMLCDETENIATASSLGIGYSLNMHQAWVPDGFALGNLLYSVVLAPGEEQRLIVREHRENYTVSDDSNAVDRVNDSYSNSQVDNETAAFNNAVDRYSSAHSDSSYFSEAKSHGGTKIKLIGGLGASTNSTSTNRGGSSANSNQRDSYDEASHAAQNFQTSIKTESERIASANRTSIRVATSDEAESISSRIIANHNHSHVMTVQYWEVAKRYRLETCIDGIELLLFIPLEIIKFMPDRNGGGVDEEFVKFSLELDEDTLIKYNKKNFDARYSNILKYYDFIEKYVPNKYRSGLNLIKKFSALPYWTAESFSDADNDYEIEVKGGFCEFDNLSATIYFNNGSRPVSGVLKSMDFAKLKIGDAKKPHTTVELKQAIINARRENEGTAKFTFKLPYGCSEDDVSQIRIDNRIESWNYTLSQNLDDMENWEKCAIQNYEHHLTDFYKDNKNSSLDQRRIDHYEPGLPECYTNPIVSFTASELETLGSTDIKIFDNCSRTSCKKENDGLFGFCVNTTSREPVGCGSLGWGSIYVDRDNSYPKLRIRDIQKIEETFHHIVSDTIYYSQVIWSSLSDDERILLLEPYTIEFDNIDKIASADSNFCDFYKKSKSISLLNCVNAKKLIGFYGNCMMLPFTFPQELVDILGKTAGDIQDELYRFHACNFRVPSTVISVPSDGMVGEAVLGATNVSEKIDITRFWNWKDSDIDHIDIDQSSLNGNSLLENANTKDVSAPTTGVVATEHVGGNNLASALINRQQPTFADVASLTDLREVMKNADNNASAGREQVVKSTSELTKAALDAAVKAGTAAATGGLSATLGGVAGAAGEGGLSQLLGGLASGEGGISNLLGALGEAGLGDANLGKLLKEGLSSGGGLEGVANSLVGMIGKGSESDALKKALSSFGGDKLKNFLSNFVTNSSNSKSLEENFTKSLSGVVGKVGDVSKDDILNMAKKFCSENNIGLDDFSSKLAKALGLL